MTGRGGKTEKTKGGWRKFPSGGPLKRHVTAPAKGHSRPLRPFDHQAIDGTTRFPSRRFPPSEVPRLLISGFNSRKIGKTVMKGKWKGFPIFTLTLVERETCPRTCKAWLTCYGNNMHYSRRIIAGPHLERPLWSELDALQRQHPRGFVVRLHVLGDFYSMSYVDFWRRALDNFPALRVFGYTARDPVNEEIGRHLGKLIVQKWDRFAVRFSGYGFSIYGAEIIEPGAKTPHVICPAQTGRTDCCATCAFCWQGRKTVAFYEH